MPSSRVGSLYGPLAQALGGAPDRASALVAAQTGLGALLASIAYAARADEGGEQAPYERGRADELADLAARALDLPDREAELRGRAQRRGPEVDAAPESSGPAVPDGPAELALEAAELAVAALRLVALAPGARELALAAGALGLGAEEAGARARELAAGEPERRAAAEALAREARSLVQEIRAAGAGVTS